jgi:hypothetical protein
MICAMSDLTKKVKSSETGWTRIEPDESVSTQLNSLRRPEVPREAAEASVTVSLRMPVVLRDYYQEIAKSQDRSLSSEIVRTLRERASLEMSQDNLSQFPPAL